MGEGLSWLTAMACLAAGGMLLVRGLEEISAGHLTLRRFREQIAPLPGGTRLALRSRELLIRLGRRIAGGEPDGELQLLLLQAGFSGPALPFLFVAARFLAALTGAAILLLPAWAAHGIKPRNAAAAFVFGFIIYRGATILLKARMEHRCREIRRELPYVLDLLLMVLDSGVSIDQALSHAAAQLGRTAPVTGQILARTIADIDDGTPYDKALDKLAQRLAVREGRDFAGLLKQNLFQGGELGPALRRLASDISEARLGFAREQMGKKSVMLTMVMLAFFMPVLMIALAGPAVSDLMGTLKHAAHDIETRKTDR
jgi:tight adherence protein C